MKILPLTTFFNDFPEIKEALEHAAVSQGKENQAGDAACLAAEAVLQMIKTGQATLHIKQPAMVAADLLLVTGEKGFGQDQSEILKEIADYLRQ